MDGDQSRSGPVQTLGPTVAVLAGTVTGGFAAWAYYDDVLRPLALSLIHI